MSIQLLTGASESRDSGQALGKKCAAEFRHLNILVTSIQPES